MERVDYYKASPYAVNYQLDRILEVFNDCDNWDSYRDINQIIELYSIDKILNLDGNFFDEEKYPIILNNKSKIMGTVARYFKQTESINFIKLFEDLGLKHNFYKSKFWELIDKFKCSLSGSDFSKITSKNNFIITDVLQFKNLSSKYGHEILKYFDDHPEKVEIIIEKYFGMPSEIKLTYYFPPELTSDKLSQLVSKYIDVTNVNPNFLYLLNRSKDNEVRVNKDVIDKAEDQLANINDEYIKKGSGFYSGVKVSFEPLDDKLFKSFMDGRDHCFIYDSNWIFNNLDYPTLLNNFIFMFGFVDLKLRWNCVSKKSMLGTFERFLSTHRKKEYLTGASFDGLRMLYQGQIIVYTHLLKDKGIKIENCLKYFFEDYLKNEFNINGFYFSPSSEGTTYLEKCRNILIEIESVLHQFKFFNKFGKIDKQRIRKDFDPIVISEIPSFIENKYIYLNHDNTNEICHLLFSDQNNFLYLQGKNEQYDTTFRVLMNMKINVNDLESFQITDLNKLRNKQILSVDSSGFITYDEKLLTFLNDLYSNEVSCNNYVNSEFEDQIDFLKEKDMITFESTLLSGPEQDYFNYLLNNRTFDNGRLIRNTYLHGTIPEKDEEIFNDYFTCLRLLILIVIKINEEFDYIDNNN